MPICITCSKPFSKRVVVDGVHKQLRNRKKCLDCSPFAQHNVRVKIDNPRFCGLCNRPYARIYGNGLCNSCHVTEWRRRVKQKCIEHLGGRCQICGYDKCNGSLSFHHKNPNEKDFGISGQTMSFEKIKKELNKCILVCRNCHGEIHAGVTEIPVV